MMSRRFLLLLLLLVPAVLLMSATVVRAEEELDDAAEDVVVPGGDAAEGSEEVTTTDGEEATSEEAADPTRGIDAKVIFPGHEDLKFAAGEPAVALIGFRNGGEVDVTVEVIEGSLRYPQDVKFHVQNFTRVGYREKVAPNTEATFLYRFRPHESFDPRDFHFVLTAIFSTGENQYFSVSPFNSTIAVTDAETSFDSKRLFSNIFLVAGAVFAVIFFLQKRTKKSGKQAAPKIETGTSDTQENEWLENMNQVPQRSPKPKSPKPKKD